MVGAMLVERVVLGGGGGVGEEGGSGRKRGVGGSGALEMLTGSLSSPAASHRPCVQAMQYVPQRARFCNAGQRTRSPRSRSE